MTQDFSKHNLYWEDEAITQKSIDTKVKEIKKHKSLFYMLKCKHMYIKLIKQCYLAIEAKRWWDEYCYSRRLRSK